jgi:hypothetical protein
VGDPLPQTGHQAVGRQQSAWKQMQQRTSYLASPKTALAHKLPSHPTGPSKETTHRLVGQQWLLHHWQIMKCVYISDNHGSATQPWKVPELSLLHSSQGGINNMRTHTQSHTHTTGWKAINYWPHSCLCPKKRHKEQSLSRPLPGFCPWVLSQAVTSWRSGQHLLSLGRGELKYLTSY